MRYITGSLAFAVYVIHIYYRWARLTYRRYGARGVLSPSYRPRRAAVGTGYRRNPLGRAHRAGVGIPVADLIRQLHMERGLIA